MRGMYMRWGALGKVKQLEQRYSGLREEGRSPGGGLVGSSLKQVDVLALAKASQAVSSELDLKLSSLHRAKCGEIRRHYGWNWPLNSLL
jgi:hypothetical protein